MMKLRTWSIIWEIVHFFVYIDMFFLIELTIIKQSYSHLIYIYIYIIHYYFSHGHADLSVILMLKSVL